MLAAMLPGLRIATCARKVSPGLLGAATVQTEAQFELLAEPQAVQRKETSAARSTLFSCPQRLQGIRIVAFISFTSFFALGAFAIRLLVQGPGEGHGGVLALVAVVAGVREGDVDHEVPG